MKRLLIVSLMFGLIQWPLFSLSQDSTRYEEKKRGFEAYIFGGFQVNNQPGLKGRLKANGISTPPNVMGMGGFGFSLRLNKLLIGVEAALTSEFFSHSTDKSHYASMCPTLFISTTAIHTQQLIISPQVGIGGLSVTGYYRKQSTASGFDQAITTEGNRFEITHDNALLDLGLALRPYKLTKRRFEFILRTGYRIGLSNNKWKVPDSDVNDGPADRLNNCYFAIGIGRRR